MKIARNLKIVSMRDDDKMEFKDIGKAHGITAQRAHQIYSSRWYWLPLIDAVEQKERLKTEVQADSWHLVRMPLARRRKKPGD